MSELTRQNEKFQIEEIVKKKQNFFIVLNGGKPIYSRYGDSFDNSEMFGFIFAMIAKLTYFDENKDFSDTLQ